MPPITIDDIKARQSELAALIERFEAQATAGRSISIERCTIELQAGEYYAGAVLDEAGHHQHHLVLMAARPDGDVTWQQAMDWAASVGGALPTRQEQALLFANCKPHLEAAWHWSSELCEGDASYAWGCYFYDGTQGIIPKSYEGRAVAVRYVGGDHTMTDRELLEAAAKAAGMEVVSQGDDFWTAEDGVSIKHWSPLTDDGDALRLAVVWV